MGNRSPKSQSGIAELSDWVAAGTDHYCQILKNPETEEEIQKFVVGRIDNENLNTELKVYLLRMTELPRAVRVLHYGYEKTGSICASPEYFVVVTERTRRLGDYSSLSLLEANDILQQTLKGFSLLFELFGLFTITADLIGINSKQEVKVWLNDNFGLNTIDEDPSIAISEKHQLLNLVAIIKGKISEESKVQNFGADILTHDKFTDAVTYIENMQKTAASLDVTAQFPVNTSTVSDSKVLVTEPQPQITAKPEVRITYQSPQRILKTSNRNPNVPVLRQYVYPPIYQKEAAPRINPQKILEFSGSYHSRVQSPTASLSRVLIHYAPAVDLKRSVVINQSAQPAPQNHQFRSAQKTPFSTRLSQQYHIPVVDSQVIVQQVDDPQLNINLSRMKMQGATIQESRVISHP